MLICLIAYLRHFESRLLLATKQYYEAVSQKLMSELNASSFMQSALDLLFKEEARYGMNNYIALFMCMSLASLLLAY